MKKILAIAIVVGAAFWVLPTDAEAGGLKIPVHGNWCGPGHSGGDTVDALDEACKRHDECYERSGYVDCMCDAQLIKDISELSPEKETMDEIALILRWFIDSPCTLPGMNNPVEAALTLLGGKLDDDDIKDVLDIVSPPSPVPGVGEPWRRVAVKGATVVVKGFRKLFSHGSCADPDRQRVVAQPWER